MIASHSDLRYLVSPLPTPVQNRSGQIEAMEEAVSKKVDQLNAESAITKLERLRDALPGSSQLREETSSLILVIKNMAEYVSHHMTGGLNHDLMLWEAVRQAAEQAIKDVTRLAKLNKYRIF